MKETKPKRLIYQDTLDIVLKGIWELPVDYIHNFDVWDKLDHFKLFCALISSLFLFCLFPISIPVFYFILLKITRHKEKITHKKEIIKDFQEL